MALRQRLWGATVAWGDSLLPPGPLRDRATAAARRLGVSNVGLVSGVPEHLAGRFVAFGEEERAELVSALEEDYFGAQRDDVGAYLATPLGRRDLSDHLAERLERTRTTVVPWLDRLRPLAGCRILEVGAGDGSATVALAEQGAEVVAVDVEDRYLKVNAVRCRLAGLDPVRFVAANGADLERVATPGEHDLILVSAALEHMTLDERLATLAGAWDLLAPGGHLVVVECPNRLWYFDDHTAFDVFFHWLPDEVAIRYAPRTPSPVYPTAPAGGLDPVAFARFGRGVSFHDFVLALGIPAERLPVASGLQEFLGLPRWLPHTRDGRFHRTIRSLAPEVPRAFFYAYLDLALEKPAA